MGLMVDDTKSIQFDYKALRWQVDAEGIATLTIDLPGEKVNKLSSWVLEELDNAIEDLRVDSRIKVLVIESAKEGVFIAGADVEELATIGNIHDAGELIRKGHRVCNRLSALPFPTIAMIDGSCVGGGLEFALGCTYRVVTDSPKTKLGLPETSLGIIPGWGGTQRLPRLIGASSATPLILAGKLLTAVKAYKIKLADAIFQPAFKEARLKAFIISVLSGAAKKKAAEQRGKRSWNQWFLDATPVGRMLFFRGAKKELIKKTGGKYPAPLSALDLIQKTCTASLSQGLEEEIQAVIQLISSPTCKNLISLFFTREDLKKDPGADVEVTRSVDKAAVLGAGTMGGGIAWLFAYKGLPVRMKDVHWDAIGLGYKAAKDVFSQLEKRRKLKPRETVVHMHRISGTTDYSGFKDADIVVEAIVEKVDVKKMVYKEVEEVIPEDCILCTNTSSLPITELASELKFPQRFVGLHFFNPVNRMPLVEVIPGEETSPETVATVVSLMKRVGKTPMVVKDCPGFLVNRILFPVLNEGGWLFEEGVGIQQVDRAMKAFGLPMGLFQLSDAVGIDVALKAAKVVEEAYGKRMKVPGIFSTMVEKGWLGNKSSLGFFKHEGKNMTLNESVESLLAGSKPSGNISDKDIVERAIYVLINEAARCLEEGVVKNAQYLDMAMLMGTGFPPYRGGPMRYADTEGVSNIVRKLELLAKAHGERFVPAELLVKMADNGQRFYN